MRRLPAIAPLFLAAAAGAQWPEPWRGPGPAPSQVRPVALLEANRPALRLPALPGGGPLDRFAPDPGAGYALVALTVRADVAVLVVLGHDARTPIRARLLDAPPWEVPAMSQPVLLERRQPRWNDDRAVEGAWLIAPAGERERRVFLMVELERGAGAAGRARPEVTAELYDPMLPASYRSLARSWSTGSYGTDLPSPLESQQRRTAQLLWPSVAAAP